MSLKIDHPEIFLFVLLHSENEKVTFILTILFTNVSKCDREGVPFLNKDHN